MSQKHASPARRAALRHPPRPLRAPRRLKPANMAVTSYSSRRGVAVLAGLLLWSLGSVATSQFEVGVRAPRATGPWEDSVVGALSAPPMLDTAKPREASRSPFASYGAAAGDVGRVSPGTGEDTRSLFQP